MDEKQARTWSMICHLSGLAWYIGIPFAGLIAPLVIWLIKREEHPYFNEQGKEAVNFNISLSIYGIIVFILCFVVIGFVLIPVLIVFQLVCSIMAAVKSNDGQPWVYPMTIRFLK